QTRILIHICPYVSTGCRGFNVRSGLAPLTPSSQAAVLIPPPDRWRHTMDVTRSNRHLSPAAPTEQSTGHGEEFPLTTFPLFS
ncbi:MAG: hypothetical protein OET42_13800, partial [Deltaproteobacteria bacterium]|nr:hypothetical protein [Deltaproteobacteria bacterium]